ncbi:hypothetical protein U3516DRAFT_869926 [Neocallimastix sp. 'constans']
MNIIQISSRNLYFLRLNIILIFIVNINCLSYNSYQNDKSSLVDQTKISSSGDLNILTTSNSTSFSKQITELNFILNYKGGNLEPEWQWVKNISVVYTWVDGSDINFQDLKSKYNGGNRKVNSRDRSADELRYSIRSLEKYMPWHEGTIYIVTCQQIPKWLNTTHSRIKIVDHKSIFPKYVFPTFDSGTIELFFDKIPGISERFIYFNDDVFLNNYIHPCFFFTREGYPKIYKNNNSLNLSKKKYKKNISKKQNLYTNMCYLTLELIHTYLDKDFKYYYLHHSTHVFYRDLMEPFRQFFKEDIKILCIDKFRSWEKFNSLYLYLTFMEYASRNDQLKLFEENKLPSDRTISKYFSQVVPASISSDLIKFEMVTDDSKENEINFNYIKNHPNILVFNFNDVYSEHQTFIEFTEFLMARFPEPSSFEKKEYVELENLTYSKLLNPPLPTKNNAKQDIDEKVSKNINLINSSTEDISLNNHINQYKMKIIEEYLRKKEELSGPKKEISNREREEIDFLLNYNGEKLTHEWEWAKKISVIYYFDGPYHFTKERKKMEINKLKYSLHSIEKYLPWFEGIIYIVIKEEDQKEFEWINLENKRIQLVHQTHLISKIENINEINRNIIELFLDKIPDISERFIYLTNNHFFINYTHPRFFFSKDFFPKYNFENILSKNEVVQQKESDKSFFYTFNIIMKYFGKNYVNGYQYLKNSPIPLYRDHFEPVRQLYKKHVRKLLNGNYSRMKSILPLYMISTYNIYGTNHPYYPNYVGGYGKVRTSKLPVINPLRTIEFYGFDMTSPAISNYTMALDISFTKNIGVINKFIGYNPCNEKEIIEKIISSKLLFFSMKRIDESEIIYDSNIDCFLKVMNQLYKNKFSSS